MWEISRRRVAQRLNPSRFVCNSKSCATRLRLAESSSTSSPEEEATPKVIEIESLSPSQIVELIEFSFIQSCLALSKGITVEPLQLFIIAVKIASKQEPSVIKVLGALKGNSSTNTTSTTTTTTKRPLDDGEETLRSTWVQAIYLMLAHLGNCAIQTCDIDAVIVNTYGPILEDLVAIQRSGLGLNTETFVERRKDVLFPENAQGDRNPLLIEQEQIDPIQFAIVSQTIKLLFYTALVDAEDRAPAISEPSLSQTENHDPSEKSSVATSRTSRGKNQSNGRGRGFGG